MNTKNNGMRYSEIITEAKHHVEMFREIQRLFPDVSIDYEIVALRSMRADMQVWLVRYARIKILEAYDGDQYAAIASGEVQYDEPQISEAYHMNSFDEEEAKKHLLNKLST